MEADAEILEPFHLHFSDLIRLSSSSSSSSSLTELERLDSISRTIMETLGPNGPGLLAITGVPKSSQLRQSLLPLARKLALLSNDDRRRILRDHGLGSDVPLKNLDRSVSSFALQLKYVQNPSLELTAGGLNHGDEGSCIIEEKNPVLASLDNEFKNLGSSFKELGSCMMELGLCLAQVCDKALGGQELEQSILESCSAKGRLIHYHSILDNLILKENSKTKGPSKGSAKCHLQLNCGASCFSEVQNPTGGLISKENEGSCRTSLSDLWQQWHYDYGIFTVLTSPMFISQCHAPVVKQVCSSPSGHTYLQIFDPNKNNILMVKSPPESFIVQVGESADILSKGRLRSTLHSVCRPIKQDNLSRETFVVFMQPSWSKTFSISGHPTENFGLTGHCSGSCGKEVYVAEPETQKLYQQIHKVIPPLSKRLKDGMTFAEFSRETTKQYYGGKGLQSNT
ncbi:uncharacterized protein LOC122089164 [Macadamia integrifolia]|uniref:uncharacterized protein LOC122089164 n=1 Tax=Macadamia integrifolia TaxID=60698 RepID=UPI001C4EE08D|nr:uncharacterized protein LOC122089164 [Macadamia integrifolia]XP_042514612.1 uncharacterized protein LOC122089164 [Macadamia integrifolia]